MKKFLLYIYSCLSVIMMVATMLRCVNKERLPIADFIDTTWLRLITSIIFLPGILLAYIIIYFFYGLYLLSYALVNNSPKFINWLNTKVFDKGCAYKNPDTREGWKE